MESFVEQMLCRYSTRLAAMCEKAALSGNETAARWMDIFRANARGKSRVRVWKERGRAIPLVDERSVLEKLDYVHNNPVRRGLCATPREYAYSSAAWYLSGEGLLEMDDFG